MAGKAIDARTYDLIEALAGFADARGCLMVDVAIGALLHRSAVGCVIAGSTRAEQVRANAVAGDWVASDSDMAELTALLDEHASG